MRKSLQLICHPWQGWYCCWWYLPSLTKLLLLWIVIVEMFILLFGDRNEVIIFGLLSLVTVVVPYHLWIGIIGYCRCTILSSSWYHQVLLSYHIIWSVSILLFLWLVWLITISHTINTWDIWYTWKLVHEFRGGPYFLEISISWKIQNQIQ